ncbi:MAG: hypothetical protein ACKOZT_09300 [Cyanobium sp.]
MPRMPRRPALLTLLLLLPLQPLAATAQPAGAAGSTAAAAAAPRSLYTLATRCSLRGGPVQACTVEAVDQGGSTYYRHRIANDTISIRITDRPVTMSQLDPASRRWLSLRNAAALFSTNTICFNDRELCVVNPNYLNSVREDRPDLSLQGRDLVRVHFGADGRVDASCYDAGCRVEWR